MSNRIQYVTAFNRLIQLGWTPENAKRELQAAAESQADYMMHDVNGNVIIDFRSLESSLPASDSISRLLRNDLEESQRQIKEPGPGQEYYEQSRYFKKTGEPWSALTNETKEAWSKYGSREIQHQEDREQELELSEEGIREKLPHDPDKEPTWTEVRGMTSFYYICPRCGAMVPGTGPQLVGPDGKPRLPKEHHENWHKSQLIDWYDDE